MTSITYRYPRVYDLFASILYFTFGININKKYKRLAELVGKNKRVLELGCGTCKLYEYLDKSCSYEGWDLNSNFLDYAKKKFEGINVKLKSVHDYSDYPKIDVIVVGELLHHIMPRHEELLDNIKSKAGKIIIIEPKFNITNKYKRKLLRIFDSLVGDDDGINEFNERVKWFNNEYVLSFFNKFKPKVLEETGIDYLVILENKKL